MARLTNGESRALLERVSFPWAEISNRSPLWEPDDLRRAVSLLQIHLGITVDGTAGEQTRHATELYCDQNPRPFWTGCLGKMHNYGGGEVLWCRSETGITTYDTSCSGGNPVNEPPALLPPTVSENHRNHALDIMERYGDTIIGECGTTAGLIPLVAMTIMTESSGDPDAVRYEQKDHSVGLMQILTGTARWLGFQGDDEELFDPVTNIHWGTEYIRRNPYRHLYDPILVAVSYNAGHVRPLDGRWGMLAHPKHIDRSIANYSAAKQALFSIAPVAPIGPQALLEEKIRTILQSRTTDAAKTARLLLLIEGARE